MATGRKVVYTPDPAITADTPVKLRCTATVRGTGRQAAAGMANVRAEESFTVLALADASAPTLSLIGLERITPGQSYKLAVVPADDGLYDTIEYAWSADAGNLDRMDGPAVTYTLPSSYDPATTKVTIRCMVTVRGTGTRANDGSIAEAQVEESANLIQGAMAPRLTLTDIDSLESGGTVVITANVSGGNYDTISYDWRIVRGGGSLDHLAANRVRYTAPRTLDPDAPMVNVVCAVEVEGDGTNAIDGDSAAVIADEFFTLKGTLAAPRISINNASSISSRQTVTFTATLTGGRYDTAEFDWDIELGVGRLDEIQTNKVLYTPVGVNRSRRVRISCTAIVKGAGRLVPAGEMATVRATEEFGVTV